MFVPYNKMSKKQQAAANKSKRTTWEFSPVSRVKPSGKVYTRKEKYDSKKSYLY